MFIFPYGTDAPIYYRPIATIGLIVVNVVVFVLQVAYPEQAREYMLEIGGGIHPVQWLTSFFMHADPMHLIGNMLFLWVFGLIIEGKLGAWKTLLIYLAIGIAENVSTQLLMLGTEHTYGLGASTAIFGLMAMCLIWAPENSVECVLFAMIHFRFIAKTFETPVKLFAGIYIGLNLLILTLKDGALSSEYFHVVGALFGFGIAVVMLRWNLVDCEYWDIYSVWRGLHKMSPEDRQRIEDEKPENRRRKAEETRKRQNLLIGEIRHAIQLGNAVPALMLVKRKKSEFPDWQLPEPEMLRLIHLLCEKKMTDEAIATMREYITLYESKAEVVRLRLAQTFLALDQPIAAMKEMDRIDPAKLDDRQRQYLADLRHMAEQRRTVKKAGDGLYELAE